MSTSRLEWKVGVFLLVALIFAGALIMKFSKGPAWFTPTYSIKIETSNVGGIRPGATILMSGVQVGTVRSIDLAPSGKKVVMDAQIQSRYHIHKDARFTIETAGVLGDQYIAITPELNKAPELEAGDVVKCQPSLNFQEVARSAAGLLQRIEQTAAKLDEAVGRVDQTILAENTLTNLTAVVNNFRVLSDQALSTLQGVDQLVQTNTLPLSTAVSNLLQFSVQLDQVTAELQFTIATNRVEITTAVQNIQKGTERLNAIFADIQAGKGLAGSLLSDETLRQQFSSTVSNLNVVSSNLSQHGLLWRPRHRSTTTGTRVYTGKLPSR